MVISGEDGAVITGTGTKTKPLIDPVPSGLVTLILPLAPLPTTAVILVDETTVNDDAATPPKLTAVVPVKFAPVIVIVVPGIPAVLLNEVICGVGITVKPGALTCPLSVVIIIFPVVAVAATIAVSVVGD